MSKQEEEALWSKEENIQLVHNNYDMGEWVGSLMSQSVISPISRIKF